MKLSYLNNFYEMAMITDPILEDNVYYSDCLAEDGSRYIARWFKEPCVDWECPIDLIKLPSTW